MCRSGLTLPFMSASKEKTSSVTVALMHFTFIYTNYKPCLSSSSSLVSSCIPVNGTVSGDWRGGELMKEVEGDVMRRKSLQWKLLNLQIMWGKLNARLYRGLERAQREYEWSDQETVHAYTSVCVTYNKEWWQWWWREGGQRGGARGEQWGDSSDGQM